jgi:RNA polymerase sigma-70 factor (sigma-E family)
MTGPSYDERFDRLATLAYRVAFRVLGDRGDAEEVAQETLARAFLRWRRIAGHDEAWVTRVATNEALGRWRKRRPTVALLDEPTATGGPGRGHDSTTVERMELAAALSRLPRRQRQVVALRYLADLPEAEVARLLHTSVGSVKQHTHRGVGRLRAELSAPLLTAEAD